MTLCPSCRDMLVSDPRQQCLWCAYETFGEDLAERWLDTAEGQAYMNEKWGAAMRRYHGKEEKTLCQSS